MAVFFDYVFTVLRPLFFSALSILGFLCDIALVDGLCSWSVTMPQEWKLCDY